MELAAKIAMLVACAFNFGVQSLYFTHMLQLNSYRNERYRKWCRDNETKLVSVRRILPVLLIQMCIRDRQRGSAVCRPTTCSFSRSM